MANDRESQIGRRISRFDLSDRPFVVWGASGHGRVVAESVQAMGATHAGWLVDIGEPTGEIDGLPVYRTLTEVASIGGALPLVALGVGDNAVRLSHADRVEAAGLTLASVVHPQAWVSPSAEIGAGATILAGAVVQARARIGRAAIVNTRASVDHDCVLGDGAHVSPGGCLAGWVTLGQLGWVGTGASVRDRVVIGDGAVIGVGSAVVRDIADHIVAFGVPARPRQDDQ